MTRFANLTSGSDKPLFNIGAAARITRISMAALRAWERRYNFPDSQRTGGGHRLYSERDILRLRWVKERIDEGMQTAQAINALRHHEQDGSLELSLVQPGVAFPDLIDGVHGRLNAPVMQHLPALKDELVESLLQLDLSRADSVLSEGLVLASPEELILDVIRPALAAIGDAWAEGRSSVAAEHLATNYLRHRLLLWMTSGPPPKPAQPILLACAPQEWHEGSLLILGALLRRRRWPVAYLGQATPLADLADFSREILPSVIVLVAMTEAAVRSLDELPRWFPASSDIHQPHIGFGGRIFSGAPEWQSQVEGTYLGDTLEQGLATIERLAEGI